MSAPTPDAVQALAELQRGLTATADALAHADLDGLLTCEARLESTLSTLSRALSHTRGANLTRAQLTDVRAALMRCRRLGDSLNDFVRIALVAQGLDDGGYGRAPAPAAERLHTIHRTV